MADHAPADLSGSISVIDFKISDHDRDILRALAGRVAALASRPIESEKKELWYRHNDLQATRPLIFCDPENGWNEILPDSIMQCRGELAQKWEVLLRKEIFWGETMGDDRVVEPFFNVPHVHQESDWGMHEKKIGGDHGGSYRWEAPLKSYDDIGKLRFPKIRVDSEATEHVLELASSVLGDLLTVRLRTSWWWTLGMTWTAVNLRGLEQLMLDMYDFPEQLKQMMAFLRDGHLAKLDYLESHGLLALNNDDAYVGSGGFGWTRQLPQKGFKPDRVRTMDMWGFCESQETVGVDPEMFAEFVYPYQKPILERFGLNCYGCCEPLDKRWHVIKDAPRLRRISVSPWASVEKMAEQLGDRYIFSYKPSPSELARPTIDEGRIRSGLRQVIETTRGCRVEIIMKDNHTLGNNPQNAVRWCKIAQEEAARASVR